MVRRRNTLSPRKPHRPEAAREPRMLGTLAGNLLARDIKVHHANHSASFSMRNAFSIAANQSGFIVSEYEKSPRRLALGRLPGRGVSFDSVDMLPAVIHKAFAGHPKAMSPSQPHTPDAVAALGLDELQIRSGATAQVDPNALIGQFDLTIELLAAVQESLAKIIVSIRLAD